MALLEFCPSMTIKLSLAFSFVQNTIIGLGTERHMKYFNWLSDNHPDVGNLLFKGGGVFILV
jgi:hypothetical protein